LKRSADLDLVWLVAGLGNPGRSHRDHRHNIGFMALDRLTGEMGLEFRRVQFQALITDGRLEDRKIWLAKPQTFMNRAGSSIGSLSRYFRIPTHQILIVYDDLDLPLGSLRLRPEGGAGGHRGISSIISVLGTQGFPRLRLGIGRPPGRMDPADYVLQDFSPGELPVVDDLLQRAAACVRCLLADGIELAMTRFNRPAD
jgi:peptidyl-tRNA hydrolase, PTH1 family